MDITTKKTFSCETLKDTLPIIQKNKDVMIDFKRSYLILSPNSKDKSCEKYIQQHNIALMKKIEKNKETLRKKNSANKIKQSKEKYKTNYIKRPNKIEIMQNEIIKLKNKCNIQNEDFGFTPSQNVLNKFDLIDRKVKQLQSSLKYYNDEDKQKQRIKSTIKYLTKRKEVIQNKSILQV